LLADRAGTPMSADATPIAADAPRELKQLGVFRAMD